MNVYKTVIQITVLSHEQNLPNWELDTIVREIQEGCSIGGSAVTLASEIVPPDRLKPELVALGNDGDFFDMMDEGETE